MSASGSEKPISKPPPAASENFRNSRRSIWGPLIWLLLSPSCRRRGELPCGCVGKCRSGKYFLSSPRLYLRRSVVAFHAATVRHSSVVRIGSSRIGVRLQRSRHAAMDDSGRKRGLRSLSLPCLPPSTLVLRRTVSPRRWGARCKRQLARCRLHISFL